MPRRFSSATAEQTVSVVDAVVVYGKQTPLDFVVRFTELREESAMAALELGTDLQLISENQNLYSPTDPLAKHLVTPKQLTKAAVLRVVLESFEPFVVFRQRLSANADASHAAHQTKTLLDLDAHRDDVKDTLLSLGTYAQALDVEGGGRYSVTEKSIDDSIAELRHACGDITRCQATVLGFLGNDVAADLDRASVMEPIAESLRHASEDLAREAIVHCGNAVESYLLWLGNESGEDLSSRTGINSRIDELERKGHLPKKLMWIGKYLGHLRNAADHGVDANVGKQWAFRDETGLEYVHVACGFIVATWKHLKRGDCIL